MINSMFKTLLHYNGLLLMIPSAEPGIFGLSPATSISIAEWMNQSLLSLSECFILDGLIY